MRKTSSFLLTLAIIAMPLVSLPAANADTIAPLVGNDTAARTQLDASSNFTIIDTNHSAAEDGEITSFSYYASNANPFNFVLVDASNNVQWISPSITPDNIGGVNTYTPDNPVSVQQNWNLGVYFSSTGTIPYEETGAAASYTAADSGQPNVGDTLNFEGNSNRTYSFFANSGTAEPVLTTISVTPTTTTLNAGDTQQFTAIALDQFGNALTTQPTFTWTSSDTSVGTIDDSGLFTAVAAGGPVTITASSDSISSTAEVSVNSSTVTPPETNCGKGMASGMISYTANGLDRSAMFNMSTNPRTNDFKGNGIFQYRDANGGWYIIKISYVAINGSDVYFSGRVIAANQKDQKGQWLYAKIHNEDSNSNDTISGSFTGQDTAIAHFTNNSLTDPADGPFTITKGQMNTKTFCQHSQPGQPQQPNCQPNQNCHPVTNCQPSHCCQQSCNCCCSE